MRNEKKSNLPRVGLKIYGHRSHVRWGSFVRTMAGSEYFDTWIKKARKYLKVKTI